MTDRELDFDFPGPYPYEGEVIERGPRGAVKVRIEPELPLSGWCYPWGMPAAGSADHGAVRAPPKGALVGVFFVGGVKTQGRYVSGHYPEGQEPAGTVISEDGDKEVWRDGRIQIERDSRASAAYRIKDQAGDGAGVLLELDFANRKLKLSSALGIDITTTGVLAMSGGTVTLNGRPVAPKGPPL
jgi:hypothetical protein